VRERERDSEGAYGEIIKETDRKPKKRVIQIKQQKKRILFKKINERRLGF
jgi:hypothetical protein